MTPMPAIGRAQLRASTARRCRQRPCRPDKKAAAFVGRSRAHTVGDVASLGDARQLQMCNVLGDGWPTAEASPRRRAQTDDTHDASDAPSAWPEPQAEDAPTAATEATPLVSDGSDGSDAEPGRPARRSRRISFDEGEVQVIERAAGETGSRAAPEAVRKLSDASQQSSGEGPPRKRSNTMHDVESLGTARRRRVCFDEADLIGHEPERERVGRRPRSHTMHDLDSLGARRLWSADGSEDLESLASARGRSGSDGIDLEIDNEEADLLNALAEMVVEDDYEMLTIPPPGVDADLAADVAYVTTTFASLGRPRGGSPFGTDVVCAAEDVPSMRLSRRPRVGSPWGNHQEDEEDGDAMRGDTAAHDHATTVPVSRRPRAGSPWGNLVGLEEHGNLSDDEPDSDLARKSSGISETNFAIAWADESMLSHASTCHEQGSVPEEVSAPARAQQSVPVKLSQGSVLHNYGGPGPLVVLVPLVPLLPVVMLLLMFLFVLVDSWPSHRMNEWWIENRQPQTRFVSDGARSSRQCMALSH